MIKQKIYKNIIARRSVMDYSPWIQLQIIIVDINEAKALAMKNQPGKSTDNKNVSGVSP